MNKQMLDKAIALVPKIKAITNEVQSKHIQRGDVAKATWLSLVSGRPAFFLGCPRINKTRTIQSLAKRRATDRAIRHAWQAIGSTMSQASQWTTITISPK